MPICPKCKQEVPANEAVSYNGHHEDCAIGNRMALPASNHYNSAEGRKKTVRESKDSRTMRKRPE